jgi:hypothetical protein
MMLKIRMGLALQPKIKSLLVAISRISPATHAGSRVTMLRSARKAKAAKSNQSGEQLLLDGVDIMEFTNDRFQFLQVAEQCGTNLNTSNDRRIPSSWILLDNLSTIDVFHNASLLYDIRQAPNEMVFTLLLGMQQPPWLVT